MKRILLEASVHQTRIAVTEDGELMELIIDNKSDESIVGNIYSGRVSSVLPGMRATFIDIGESKNAFYYYGEKGKGNEEKKEIILKPKVGDEIIVQVEKAASVTKGAVVTTKISFPGKFLVLIPNENEIGISKKITDMSERTRIKEIAERVLPENYGIVIRTEAWGKTEEDYKIEIARILSISENVMNKGKYVKAPALIHKDFSPVIKAARELFNDSVTEFITNGKEEYDQLLEICSKYGYDENKILWYKQEVPLFENYFVESQVEKAFHSKIWLKSGGFLIIEQTEACVVIDVNTGKYTGKKNLQATIMKTNTEAAIEISKQLRLKNLSGMIIVDFIDLKEDSDKKMLKRILEKAVSKDRIKTVVVGMTELGLMQITRKKMRPTLIAQMSTLCKCCNGTGRVPTIDWTVGELRRQVISIFVQTIFDQITIKADIRLLNVFSGKNQIYKNMIEKEYGKDILLEPVENSSFGYFEIFKRKK